MSRFQLSECNERQRKLIQQALDSWDVDKSAPQSPVIKPPILHEPVAAKEGKGGDTKRLHVCVVSYRRRLCDADNLCPKYFIDCLRYAEIIKDDSAKYITLEVRQERSKEEYTTIEITPI